MKEINCVSIMSKAGAEWEFKLQSGKLIASSGNIKSEVVDTIDDKNAVKFLEKGVILNDSKDLQIVKVLLNCANKNRKLVDVSEVQDHLNALSDKKFGAQFTVIVNNAHVHVCYKYE